MSFLEDFDDDDFELDSPSFALLPDDVLLDLAQRLDSKHDVLNLSLTNKRVFSVASTVLYAAVTIHSVNQCTTTLGMLKREPSLARHVRELVVRLKTKAGKSQKPRYFDSIVASAAVRDLAETKTLDALTTFAWDDDELPGDDSVWYTLRVCCPQLRYISTTLGAHSPSPDSHLFRFKDLRGFSLFLQHGFYEVQRQMLLFGETSLADTLWDMLIHQCPNLEELAIDGSSSLPADMRQLVNGHWPKLKRLSLGDVVVDWDVYRANHKSPFISFLEEHKNLSSLSLSRRNLDPAHFTALDPEALHLTSFSGTFQQLQVLTHLHPYIESVSFREQMQTRDVTTLAGSGILKGLVSLNKLKISFLLHSIYDSSNLLRSLIASCPNLRHLDLTCGSKPCFQLTSLSRTLQGFPKLRVLRLTVVKCPGDGLSSSAARIARANPHLEKLSLTFLPEPSLPFPLVTSKDVGSFTIQRDPLTLRACERRRFIWPFGLGKTSRTRRYTSDLTARQRPSSVGGLLIDNSVAGEELRMILLCAFLVCLACTAFAVNGTKFSVNV